MYVFWPFKSKHTSFKKCQYFLAKTIKVITKKNKYSKWEGNPANDKTRRFTEEGQSALAQSHGETGEKTPPILVPKYMSGQGSA